MIQLRMVIDQILEARREVSAHHSVLTAITGIDGSGKGYVTERILHKLSEKGIRTAAINIDGWLNLPSKRFSAINPAEHFYTHAIRFEEMFSQLVFPLRAQRSLQIEANYVEEATTEYRRQLYEYHDVDIILLEGIYLLKRAFQSYYDLSFWIECSFETALERAISRAQEGLGAEETKLAYRTIYFPAQEIHFILDSPKTAATFIVNNDAQINGAI